MKFVGWRFTNEMFAQGKPALPVFDASTDDRGLLWDAEFGMRVLGWTGAVSQTIVLPVIGSSVWRDTADGLPLPPPGREEYRATKVHHTTESMSVIVFERIHINRRYTESDYKKWIDEQAAYGVNYLEQLFNEAERLLLIGDIPPAPDAGEWDG